MIIIFDQEMVAPQNLSLLNSSNIDIYVDPSEERQTKDVNLTWNMTKFEKDEMIIILIFENPFKLSPLIR